MSSSQNSTGPGWIDYDYAVVRLVPRVDLGAFVNIGVVIHARTAGFLDARLMVDQNRIETLAPGFDIPLLERYVDAYLRVCHGGVPGAPIGLLPASERFHWLTAPRSAVLQTSPVHPGRCRDLALALETLFRTFCSPREIAE
jgi:hypothetical protein